MRKQLSEKEETNGKIQYTDKEILVKLAEKGDVKSYRMIEQVIQNSHDEEITKFAYTALKVAQMNLENELSDVPFGFISSGLGGEGNKLRYYFVVISEESITEEKESKIENNLIEICNHSDSRLETVENFEKYVLIKILVSVDFAIGNVIDELTAQCSFLEKEYFCTNVERPTHELIEKWLNDELE